LICEKNDGAAPIPQGEVEPAGHEYPIEQMPDGAAKEGALQKELTGQIKTFGPPGQ
jgi:hypothetical protein